MGEEKEVFWLVKLLFSKYNKKLFGSKSGCKRDFEVELNVFENDKSFRKFLDNLIEINILELSETYKRGKYYSVNKKRLIEKLKREPIYLLFKKAIDENMLLFQ